MNFPYRPPSARHQPIFNLPGTVAWLIAVLLAIHFVRTYLITPETDLNVLLAFAFIPARVTDAANFAAVAPGGEAAALWSFLTYAFLHADWGHVAINSVWLAVFGTPLARRFGATRFLLFSAVGAIGGAAFYLLTNIGLGAPMIGASAAVSAQMAGASRFALSGGMPLMGAGAAAYRRPALPLSAMLRDRRVVAFLAVWFAINLLFGLAGWSGGPTSGAIAWQAHIGGFLAGLALFPYFDPIRPDAGAGAPTRQDGDAA